MSKRKTKKAPKSEEPNKPKLTRWGTTVYANHKVDKKYRVPRGIIAVVVVFFLGALASAVPFSRITVVNRQIATAQRDINIMRANNRTMRAQIAERFSLDEIERIATTRLGMTRPDPAQVLYIYVPPQSHVMLNMNEPIVQENYFWQEILGFFQRLIRR